MKSLLDINIEKSRSGVYKDNEENRRLHRVGQRYGEPKKEGEPSRRVGKDDTPKNGVYLYPVRKDGSKYAKPSFYKFYGDEKTAEDVIARLEKQNPGQKFVKDKDSGVSSLPTKEDLESSKDGSSIVVENVQTGNTVIFYSKRDGRWFSNHAMMTGGIDTNPERMSRTLQGYNKKPYSIKPDLKVDGSASDIKDLKRDKKGAGKGEKKNLVQRVKDFVIDDKGAGKIEQDWEDKIKDYISEHYPTQANVTAETNSPKGREEREKMKNDPELKRMLDQQDREFKEADEREQDEQEVKYDFREKNQEDEKKGKPEQKPVEQLSPDEGVFTRVSFPDVPNAHKVNLKKYLSAKRKAAVDEAWNKAGFDNVTRERVGVFQESYNKLREQFNNSFDSMSKAERAELLYKILKVKNSMERGSKGSGSTSTPVMYPGKSIKPDRNDPNSYSRKLKDALSALGSNEVVMPAHKVGSIKDTRNALSDSWVVSDNMSAEGKYENGGKYYLFKRK